MIKLEIKNPVGRPRKSEKGKQKVHSIRIDDSTFKKIKKQFVSLQKYLDQKIKSDFPS